MVNRVSLRICRHHLVLQRPRVIPIREVEGVSDKIYLFYYLLLPDVRALLRERMQGTTGRLRLGPKTLAELEIPLPPLAEQRRIVAKLEVLFTQLDAAVGSLKKAQGQLQRYRPLNPQSCV